MKNAKRSNLGIQGIDHVDFVVRSLGRAHQFYAGKMGFTTRARSSRAHTLETGEQAIVCDAGRIRIQVSSPLETDSSAARFLTRHPEGVRSVVFRVADLASAWKVLEERGACFLDEPQGFAGYRWFAISSPLGDVEYRFIEKEREPSHEGPPDRNPGAFDPRMTPDPSECDHHGRRNPHQFTHIDHITSNTREITSLVNWYRDVLGFEHFWDIRFHTRDAKPDMQGGSGLQSIVMRDPESNIKFATNEPLRPNYYASQIAKYVEDNRGPGVQHVALSTRAIMGVIPQMEAAGLRFLDVPDAYYRMLPKRLAENAVTNLKDDIEELRRRRILVDGRDDRYLLQIFMQEAALLHNDSAAGPFFYEVIQRHGAQGFGEGNFRALFESLERQQTSTAQLRAHTAVGQV